MPIEPIGPVVVGVDGSSTSLDAVEFAAEEATARVLVDVAVARATAAHPGLAVAGEVLSGEPARVLADRAVDADRSSAPVRRFTRLPRTGHMVPRPAKGPAAGGSAGPGRSGSPGRA